MVIAFTADGDTDTSSSCAGVRRLRVVQPGSVGRKLHFRKLPLVHHCESLLRMIGGMERGHWWLAEGDEHDDAERCEQHRHHQPTAAVAASVPEYRHNNRDSDRAGNEPSRSLKFCNHREGSYQDLLYVENALCFHI